MEEKDEQQSGTESAPGGSMGGVAREDRGDLEEVTEKSDWELACLSSWRQKSPGDEQRDGEPGRSGEMTEVGAWGREEGGRWKRAVAVTPGSTEQGCPTPGGAEASRILQGWGPKEPPSAPVFLHIATQISLLTCLPACPHPSVPCALLPSALPAPEPWHGVTLGPPRGERFHVSSFSTWQKLSPWQPILYSKISYEKLAKFFIFTKFDKVFSQKLFA